MTKYRDAPPRVVRRDKYSFQEFKDCFCDIATFNGAVKRQKPGAELYFKNKRSALCFIYWAMKLGRVEPYEAAIYNEEIIHEIYKDG